MIKKYPKTRFSALVDHPVAMAALGGTITRPGLTLDVLMDLNVGQNRTGIANWTQCPLSLYEQMAKTPGLIPTGFHVYDGHNHQESLAERKAAVDSLLAPVFELLRKLEKQGIPDTSARVRRDAYFLVFAKIGIPRSGMLSRRVRSFSTITAMDRNMPIFRDWSLRLYCSRAVISRPSATRVTFDLGYKAVASDPPAGKRCVLLNVPEYTVVLQNEEHLAIRNSKCRGFQARGCGLRDTDPICRWRDGTSGRNVVEAGRVTGTWDIIGRDRVLTI